jgi:hypothetical protein
VGNSFTFSLGGRRSGVGALLDKIHYLGQKVARGSRYRQSGLCSSFVAFSSGVPDWHEVGPQPPPRTPARMNTVQTKASPMAVQTQMVISYDDIA